jgi:hypothetical protein
MIKPLHSMAVQQARAAIKIFENCTSRPPSPQKPTL